VAVEAKAGAGSYQYQHNAQVMALAAAEYASGRKALGRRLVGLLAKAQPRLFWSSPTHPGMTVEKILAGLEKDDGTVQEFLADQGEWWAETVNLYGPARSSPRLNNKRS
jgi:hypothetical protein